jgi:hypothetical protein
MEFIDAIAPASHRDLPGNQPGKARAGGRTAIACHSAAFATSTIWF